MRLLLIVTILNMTLLQENAHAFDIKDFKESIRPYLTEYLGFEKSNQILGEIVVEIPMPPIPKISDDVKATDIYDDTALRGKDIQVKDKEKYDLAFVSEVFMVTRMSKPNAPDVAKWMNVLSQGATREGIYRAVVLDNTYAGLENFNKPVTDKIVIFAKFFLKKFVAQSISPEVLQKMNFFTLKRLTAEKALEVIDAFGTDQNDLLTWYGVLSLEFAQKYPYVWENDLRKDNNFKRHKNWADSVPRQHLKSETVIKIHKVFNKLLD